MTPPPELSFRTKTGVCTVTPERIVLSRTGARGVAAEVIVGQSMLRALLPYPLIAHCGVSATPVIERAAIKRIEEHSPSPRAIGATCV